MFVFAIAPIFLSGIVIGILVGSTIGVFRWINGLGKEALVVETKVFPVTDNPSKVTG